WLSEVAIYSIFRLAGWAGLLIVFSGLITLAFWITYRRCEGKPYVAALATLLAALSAAPLFGVRPQMVTLLLASTFIAMLSQYSRDGQSKRLWWMVPMMLSWVNFHAGYALGLGLIGLFLISIGLDQKWHLVLRLALVLIACTIVVPLNPNGFRMFS